MTSPYPNRHDWPVLTAQGAVVWPVLVIVGVQFVFVPPGCPMTQVRWSGAADIAFWPNVTGSSTAACPCLQLLEVDHGIAYGVEIHPSDSSVDVSPPSIVLYDIGGPNTPTGLFSSRDKGGSAPLSASLAADGLFLNVTSTTPLGVANTTLDLWIGQEVVSGTIQSDGVTVSSLLRGLYGTTPYAHAAATGNTNARAYTALNQLNGRRASLFWVVQDPSDPTGVTGLDPEMMQAGDGVICPGGGAAGATWAIKLAPWSQAPANPLQASLGQWVTSGIAHVIGAVPEAYPISGPSLPPPYGPLAITWNQQQMYLQDTYSSGLPQPYGNGSPVGFPGDGGSGIDLGNNGGFSPTAVTFVQNWNAQAARRIGINDVTMLQAGIQPGTGALFVRAASSSSLSYLGVTSRLYPQAYIPDSSDTISNASWTGPSAFPDTFMPLDMVVYLGIQYASLIPATPLPVMSTYPPALNGPIQVTWTLSATIGSETKTAQIYGVVADARSAYCAVYTQNPNPALAGQYDPSWVITEPTAVTLGVWVSGPTWWECLEQVALALTAFPGAAAVYDSVDWVDVANVALRSTLASPLFPIARNGAYDLSKSFADNFEAEVRLAGGVMIQRYGRLTWRTFASITAVSTAVAVMTPANRVLGSIATVEDSRDRPVAAFSLKTSDGSTYVVEDVNANAEAGGSTATWEAEAPAVLPPTVYTPQFVQELQTYGLNIISTWNKTYRVLNFKGTLSLLGLQVGDVVSVVDWLTPAQTTGERGFSGSGQILSVKPTVFGSSSAIDITVMLANAAFNSPYAPELLVAAGGITASVGVIQIDATTYGGESGSDGFGAIAQAQGGVDAFVVGDDVCLIQVGVATPATPYNCIVTATDPTAVPPTITVSPAPTSAWASYATNAVGVMVTYRDYTAATNVWPDGLGQQDYCFVADSTTLEITSGVFADRWQ